MVKKKGICTKLLVLVLVICVMVLSLPITGMAAFSFTKANFTSSFNSFMTSYYKDAGDFKTNLTDAGTIHFWEAGFIRQMLVDNYLLTGNNKDKISETYYRYENTHNVDRFGNPKCWIINDSDWSDDYSWQAQFTMSAYAATGDQHMLDQAKWHFNYFYTNYVDSTWGGGMWRERGVQNQKDVPTNGWAIVAAKLAKYYPTTTVHNNSYNTDKTYIQIAIDMYNWMKSNFMRADGGIENSITSAGLGWDDNLYTYNAGIMIELASLIYDVNKTTSYLNDAVKMADFAKSHFTTGTKQVVVYEDDVGGSGLYTPNPKDSYETVFKGILMRGVYNLIKLGGKTQYIDWLSNNAQSAYDKRTNNLPSANWNAVVSNGRATGVASGLSIMAYSLMTSTPSTGSYYRIKNRWTGDYMHLENKNGKVQYGPLNSNWVSMKWVVEDVGSGYKRIKNLWTNDYLHIENVTGAIQYGPLNTSWESMQWQLLPNGSYTNIKCRWSANAQLMHIENKLGYVQGSSSANTGWFSAQWTLEPTN